MPFACLLSVLLYVGCAASHVQQSGNRQPMNYREEMRRFVQEISAYSKGVRPSFVVIPQNGHELLLQTPGSSLLPAEDYLAAIDGVGQESLFFGYSADDVATPEDARDYTRTLLQIAKNNGKTVLSTDYCSTPNHVDSSLQWNRELGFVPFPADHRALDNIPADLAPPLTNAGEIRTLSDISSFLYLINPGAFPNKEAFLRSVSQTNYDLVVVDLFFGREMLTAEDVAILKAKSDGGNRLVVAYMSIGEAEDYRYYWKLAWAMTPPTWLADANPSWPGNYKVRYWQKDWQTLVSGYLQRILDTGFDGVYLDIIDAFEHFESAEHE